VERGGAFSVTISSSARNDRAERQRKTSRIEKRREEWIGLIPREEKKRREMERHRGRRPQRKTRPSICLRKGGFVEKKVLCSTWDETRGEGGTLAQGGRGRV